MVTTVLDQVIKDTNLLEHLIVCLFMQDETPPYTTFAPKCNTLAELLVYNAGMDQGPLREQHQLGCAISFVSRADEAPGLSGGGTPAPMPPFFLQPTPPPAQATRRTAPATSSLPTLHAPSPGPHLAMHSIPVEGTLTSQLEVPTTLDPGMGIVVDNVLTDLLEDVVMLVYDDIGALSAPDSTKPSGSRSILQATPQIHQALLQAALPTVSWPGQAPATACALLSSAALQTEVEATAYRQAKLKRATLRRSDEAAVLHAKARSTSNIIAVGEVRGCERGDLLPPLRHFPTELRS